MKRILPILIALTIGYFILPTVSNLVAGLTFPNKPAPWESVVGLYFPNGATGSSIESPHFGTLRQCKNWSAGMTEMHQGYGRGAAATWVCGWGILRPDKQSGLPKMRDYIQSE